MTVITTEQTIEKIIENFDFDKVQKVMKFLDWTWNFEKNPPSVEQLKKAAIDKLRYCSEVLNNSKKKKGVFCRGGGFVATANYKDSEIYLSLSFQIVSFHWSTNDTN